MTFPNIDGKQQQQQAGGDGGLKSKTRTRMLLLSALGLAGMALLVTDRGELAGAPTAAASRLRRALSLTPRYIAADVNPKHRIHPGFGDQGSVVAPSSADSWPPGKHSPCAELHPDITLQTELYPEEKELFAKYARGRTSYLEWGTGGSSDIFTRLIDGPVYSIENFPQWCQAVQETPYVACRIAEGSMSFHCVDTGPVAAYGNPARKEDVPRFVDYVRGNEAFPNLLPTYDLVFDDGRSREAVAYQAYHHMTADSFLIVHDYPNRDDMERQYYRDIERYFDKVDSASRLAVFRKKMDVDPPSQGMIEEQALTYHR